VQVVRRHQRRTQFLRDRDELWIGADLLRKPVILEFDEEILGAKMLWSRPASSSALG